MPREPRGLSQLEAESERVGTDWRMKPPTTEQEVAQLSMREAVLPPKVQRWRQKLSCKAKEQKRYRFYSLYDKIIDKETLTAAYRKARANDGAPGTDGVTFARIDEVIGEERFVDELHGELTAGRYKASPVRRVYIPKANGKLRPLGIPVIQDRVVQEAVLLIIEPIFEADFEDCSYGFRPGRNAHQALERIATALKEGKTEVYDADLAGYFDSIPHDKLMKCLRMRVVDGAVLKLIKQWLEAPVVEEDQNDQNRRGKPRRKVTRNTQGTPQGGVISPLLANLYLHWFDRAVYGENGPAKWAKVELVRYADDFVLLCRKITPRLESFVTEKIEQWLELKINRDKTRIYEVKASESGLDFLGFNFQLAPSPHGPKRRYWRIAPSKKSEQREVARVREMISNKQQHIPVTELIGDINRHLRGWKAYYGKWHCGAAMRKINWHVENRVIKHLRRRSQRPWRVPEGTKLATHLRNLGLVRL
jgi:RNA-directed DNA polymerase